MVKHWRYADLKNILSSLFEIRLCVVRKLITICTKSYIEQYYSASYFFSSGRMSFCICKHLHTFVKRFLILCSKCIWVWYVFNTKYFLYFQFRFVQWRYQIVRNQNRTSKIYLKWQLFSFLFTKRYVEFSMINRCTL